MQFESAHSFWKAVSGECEEQSRSYDMVRGPLREVTEYSLLYADEYISNFKINYCFEIQLYSCVQAIDSHRLNNRDRNGFGG